MKSSCAQYVRARLAVAVAVPLIGPFMHIPLASAGDAAAADDAATAPAPAIPAYAAPQRVVLDEVVVTATKRDEKLKDVPETINVITSEDITARGFNNFADYVNTVPGMYMQDLGPGQNQVFIRGLVGTQGGGGFPLATYFGEAVTSLVTTNGGFPDLRLVDIDRVEIAQGPQGTLYGANSLAGVMRIIPKAPNLSDVEASFDGSGWATAHSGGGSDHAEGMINLPLITDKLAVRFVAYQDHVSGYIDNTVPAAGPIDWTAPISGLLQQYGLPGLPDGALVVPGHDELRRTDVNSEDIWGARGSVRWIPVDGLKVDLSWQQQEARVNSQTGVQPAVGPYDTSLYASVYSDPVTREQEGIGQLVVSYDVNDVRILSATGYTSFQRYANQDYSWGASNALGLPLPWSFFDRQKASAITEEIRVSSTGDGPFQWLAGYYYMNSGFDSNEVVPDYSCPTCISMAAPEIGKTGLASPYIINTNGFQPFDKQKQHSVFVNLSYNFFNRLKAEIGGRYLKDYVEVFTPAADGFSGNAAQPPAGGTNSVFNPSASLSFKINDDATTYVQASKGFRSGTPNGFTAYSGTPDENGVDQCAAEAQQLGVKRITDPDTLWTYELGLKTSLFDNKVSANLSVFHQKWEGVQLFAVEFSCAAQAIVNGGDASGNGVQLDVSAKLTEGLSFNLAGSWVRNKFDRVNEGVAATEGYSTDMVVPGAPVTNASAGLQYDFGVFGWNGFARADYTYVGGVSYVFSAGQDPETGAYLFAPYRQGGYGTANLRLSFNRNNFGFDVFARNLTDKYAAETTGDPTQGGYSYLVRPREVGVEVRYKFAAPKGF